MQVLNPHDKYKICYICRWRDLWIQQGPTFLCQVSVISEYIRMKIQLSRAHNIVVMNIINRCDWNFNKVARIVIITAWKVVPIFLIFGQNTKRHSINLCIQSKHRKIWTRKNLDGFGYFGTVYSAGKMKFSIKDFFS